MKVAILSDSHSYLGADVIECIQDVDEIWHAGDIGTDETYDQLLGIGPVVRAVYGNIDSGLLRRVLPETAIWSVDGLKVLMTHIGGYPPRYLSKVKAMLMVEKPRLYICGHSHICRIMPDKQLSLIHINPGAVGFHGFHTHRTLVTLDIDAGRMTNVQVIELGLRSIKT